MKAMKRAQMVRVVPGIAQMTRGEQMAMGFDPEAVAAVAAKMEGGLAPADGANPTLALNGWSVVAKEGVKRFYDQLSPLDGFSTTISQEFEVPGNPKVLPKMEVPIYDNAGSAQVDDFSSYDERDSAGMTSAEVVLHKVEDVITIFARDIERGVELQPQIDAALSRVANGVQDVIFSALAVGAAQGDDATKKVKAINIKAVGDGFGYGYANRQLTEAIQPRVHAMLFNSEYYGELKEESRDSLKPTDLDADMVMKVRGLEKLGEGCVGLLTNKRGAGIGLKAPYYMQGAYASYQQLQHEGQNSPIAVVSYYLPAKNCIKIVFGVYVGVVVTDAEAIKPLIPAAS